MTEQAETSLLDGKGQDTTKGGAADSPPGGVADPGKPRFGEDFTIDVAAIEGLPEAFYKDGKLAVGKLHKALTDTQASLRAKPKAPDQYKLQVPQKHAAIKVAPDYPFAVAAMGWARKHGLPQEAFDELVAHWADDVASGVPDRAKEEAVLTGKWGGEAPKRLNDLAAWAAKTFTDPAERQVVARLTAQADRVMLLHRIMTEMATAKREPSMPGAALGGASGEELNDAALKAKMRDPRYWRDKDPNFIKEVEDGWKKLYPSGQAA